MARTTSPIPFSDDAWPATLTPGNSRAPRCACGRMALRRQGRSGRNEGLRHLDLPAARRDDPGQERGAILSEDVGKGTAGGRDESSARSTRAARSPSPRARPPAASARSSRRRVSRRGSRTGAHRRRGSSTAGGRPRDRRAVGEARVRIGPELAVRVPGGLDARDIVFEQRLQLWNVVEGEAVLVLRDDLRLVQVEAAEMEKGERHAVDPESSFVRLELPVGQAPVTDVVSGVAQDVHAFEQPRHEVEPALVHEQALPDVVDALVVAALAPPFDEALDGRHRCAGPGIRRCRFPSP